MIPPFSRTSLRTLALFAAIFIIMMHGAGTHAAEATPAPPTTTPATTAGVKVVSLDELFATLDKDHDGRISREEAGAAYGQRFAQWDANGDGFATREEIHNYRLRFGIDDDGNRIAGFTPQPGVVGNRRGQAARPAAQASVLREPADWRLETMAVPPSFAPEVKFKGTEEIRFAPGMFDNTSSSYFTCIIGLTLDGAPNPGVEEIRDFLEQYYRGLSVNVGRRKGLTPDADQIRATVTAQPSAPDTARRFEAGVVYFDTFSDGRKITLNVEALVVRRLVAKQTCVILMVSPSGKDTPVWKELRAVGEKAAAKLFEGV